MRRPSITQRDSRRLDVKMTPMIDVVFLLLIFFVCTASFQTPEETLQTNLSLSGTTPADVKLDPQLEDLEEIVVRLSRDGGRMRWEINERTYRSLDEVRGLLTALVRIQVNLPVILDVEGDVPLGRVITLYDLCRQLGFERVEFAASADVS